MSAFDLSPAASRRALAPLGLSGGDDDIRERHATVVWCLLTEPGDSVARRIIAGSGAAAGLEAVLGGGLVSEVTPRELAEGCRRWLPRLSAEAVDVAVRTAASRGVQLVTRSDAEWPEPLDDLGDHAPLCLWVRGDAAALRRVDPSVAIVGARAATGYGEHVAMELTADLAGTGVAVVSGGAYGIDGAAHRATLAAGGLTVALLAGGADRAYPAGHTQLIDDISRRGVVASEVPCGSAPTKWRFLQRNRLIAALAGATVVVEAGWRSGSLNTAGHAAALSRPLGAVPGPITSAASAGTLRLIREYGAECITGAEDVREMLGLTSAAQPPAVVGGYTDDTTRVLDALSSRAWRGVGEIARRAGMAPDAVTAGLGVLALTGQAECGPRGWRRAPGGR
ncbi:DNA-processing protein DprA [Microbacterium atlanticum]|uniref:DNA-processing protein DprA n=1 Tax=Microbacterium atlanticum TaxID=2782168 RepID=UPI0018876B98|nr:DNA-processing protein DprA [Microbacterium atlanticum]